jgi:hypothetical protein
MQLMSLYCFNNAGGIVAEIMGLRKYFRAWEHQFTELKLLSGNRMALMEVGKLLIFLGLTLIVAGFMVMLLGRMSLPLGRLPGDFLYRRKNTTVYFPLATSLVVSVVLSILLYLVSRWRR